MYRKSVALAHINYIYCVYVYIKTSHGVNADDSIVPLYDISIYIYKYLYIYINCSHLAMRLYEKESTTSTRDGMLRMSW